MIHKCDYCEVELARHMFCTPAHKMAYKRKGVTKGNKPIVMDTITKRSTSKVCIHGAMQGLCKKGC